MPGITASKLTYHYLVKLAGVLLHLEDAQEGDESIQEMLLKEQNIQHTIGGIITSK